MLPVCLVAWVDSYGGGVLHQKYTATWIQVLNILINKGLVCYRRDCLYTVTWYGKARSLSVATTPPFQEFAIQRYHTTDY